MLTERFKITKIPFQGTIRFRADNFGSEKIMVLFLQ